jgi:hypothetical protein
MLKVVQRFGNIAVAIFRANMLVGRILEALYMSGSRRRVVVNVVC